MVLNSYGDRVTEAQLESELPKAPGGGVLSVDLLLAARHHGFEASLVAGDADIVGGEIGKGHPPILMLKLLGAPGVSGGIYHYVVVDGFDPDQQLFRLQFGDGKVRWAPLERLERAWRGAAHATLLIRPQRDLARELRHAVELERADRWNEAAAAYQEITAAWPDSPRAWVNLGNVEARLDRREESERAYRRALALSPDLADALNNLACLLLGDGSRLEEAETLARAANREAGADHSLTADTLGRVQLARGRCAEAETTFAAAIGSEEAPPSEGRAELLEGLGQAHRACGHAVEAHSSFLRALEARPSPQTRRSIEAALQTLSPP